MKSVFFAIIFIVSTVAADKNESTFSLSYPQTIDITGLIDQYLTNYGIRFTQKYRIEEYFYIGGSLDYIGMVQKPRSDPRTNNISLLTLLLNGFFDKQINNYLKFNYKCGVGPSLIVKTYKSNELGIGISNGVAFVAMIQNVKLYFPNIEMFNIIRFLNTHNDNSLDYSNYNFIKIGIGIGIKY